MWRWPSKRFWRIKSAFFVLLLAVLCASAVVAFWSSGMLAFGPPRPDPTYLRVMGWFAVTPIRPSENFPTDAMFSNLLIAVGVNVVVWAWCGSLAIASVVEAVVRVQRSWSRAERAQDRSDTHDRNDLRRDHLDDRTPRAGVPPPPDSEQWSILRPIPRWILMLLLLAALLCIAYIWWRLPEFNPR